jgi:flagellar FliL protein
MARKKKNADDAAEAEEATPHKGGNGKLIIAIVMVNALMLGGVVFLTKGNDKGTTAVATEVIPADKAKDEHKSVPCEVAEADSAYLYDDKGEPIEEGGQVPLDAVTVTLQDGGYLKFAVALQLSKETKAEKFVAENEGEKARSVALESFTCRTTQDVSTAAGQQEAKDEVAARVVNAYHGKVLDVYFTEWIIQAGSGPETTPVG